MSALPPFAVTSVGSWPRTPEVLAALRARRSGALDATGFARIADAAVREALAAQQAAGVDLVTDGEQRRDNFYSFVAEKLDGVRLMTLAEMLEVVEDREGFARLLDSLDAPAYAISNPTCVGRLGRREPLALDELAFVRRHTDLPVKVALPGPYLLTRAMWVPELARAAYPDKETLADDVVAILRAEALALRDAGVAFLQFDEPVLSELVFGQGRTRTFMCAALATRGDPGEELEFAVSLVNRVVEGLDGLRTGLHVCRGNWSTDERTLLAGSYRPLARWLARVRVTQLVLEYATPRAGEFVPMPGHELGLGAVNPRTSEVESVADVIALAGRALAHVPAGRLFLNPDCGFGTFARRPVATPALARAKLGTLAAAARVLRERAGAAPGL